MSGLAAAHILERNHVDYLVLEREEVPGGRVASDEIDGLVLDRGFQVVLEDYPELRRLLPIGLVPFERFHPGLYVDLDEEEPVLVSDPRRVPGMLGETFTTLARLVGPADPAAVARLATARTRSVRDLANALPGDLGRRVLGPLARGVTLDPDLASPLGEFAFVIARFLRGPVSLPARGMADLPRRLAAALPDARIRYGQEVTKVASHHVELATGETLAPDWIILAVDLPSFARLSGEAPPRMRSVGSAHLVGAEPVLPVPAVFVPPLGSPIWTVAEPSAVALGYVDGDPSRHLVSVSMDPSLDATETRAELEALLPKLGGYELVHHTVVHGALPAERRHMPVLARGVVAAGDFLGQPSMNTALRTGREAALMVLDARARERRTGAVA